MNCGFRTAAAPAMLPVECQHEALCYELYAALIEGTPIARRDVLELGSGRGGGARYIHRVHQPRRLVALDYAEGIVRWCRTNFSAPGLEFVRGDALSPHFADESFDVIVAVELTHCIFDKPRFLANAARLLRPGGRLLVADFFYRNPASRHALPLFEEAVARSGFVVMAADDWTHGVVAAIEQDSDRRISEIGGSVPPFLQKIATSFSSTTASSTYRGLREGRTAYRRYVLEKGI